MVKKIAILLGIIFRRVFTGPLEASIDITNRCGVGCITCWFYSPLRRDTIDPAWARQQMEIGLFKKIIDDFRLAGIQRVMIGGSGEPFYHPAIFDMIEYAKHAGMAVNSATSGIYFTEKNLKRLCDSGLDDLNISILAATPQTYLAMHPNQKESAYDAILFALRNISAWKKESGRNTPRINLVYVVCNLNYTEIDTIVDIAAETCAESITLKRLATMPFTEQLLLDKDTLPKLNEHITLAEEKARRYNVTMNTDDFKKHTFTGMISGDYTSRAYTEFPCYIGWIYTRVLCDSTVVPCCGCSDYSMGDFRTQSFNEIWYGKTYREFRQKAIAIIHDKTIMKTCACHSCAHVLVNKGIHNRLHPFRKKQVT